MLCVFKINEVTNIYYLLNVYFKLESSIPKTQVHSILYLIFLWQIVLSAIVGDIAPSDGVPKFEKSRREKEALEHMCRVLGGGSRGKRT